MWFNEVIFSSQCREEKEIIESFAANDFPDFALVQAYFQLLTQSNLVAVKITSGDHQTAVSRMPEMPAGGTV